MKIIGFLLLLNAFSANKYVESYKRALKSLDAYALAEIFSLANEKGIKLPVNEDKGGGLPLTQALREDRNDIVELLIDNGAFVNKASSALRTLAKNDVAVELLEKRARLEEREDFYIKKLFTLGNTNFESSFDKILEQAAMEGVRINMNGLVNYSTQYGSSNGPLLIAALVKKKFPLAKSLLLHGSDPNVMTNSGYTTDFHTRKNSRHDLTRLITQRRQEIGRVSEEVPMMATNYSWKNCEKFSKGGHTYPFDEQGLFIPECAPDVLYSWMRPDFFSRFKKNPYRSKVYTWRTPLGTHGYGTVPVRFKLKPNVNFVLLNPLIDPSTGETRNCDQFPPEEKHNTVYVSYLSNVNISEYIICGDVWESWSSGTPRHAREFLREKETIDNLTKKFGVDAKQRGGLVDLFARRNGKNESVFQNSCSYFGFGLDSHITDWSMNRLNGQVRRMREIINRNEAGYIYFNDETPHDVDRHFESKYDSYFNPRNI